MSFRDQSNIMGQIAVYFFCFILMFHFFSSILFNLLTMFLSIGKCISVELVFVVRVQVILIFKRQKKKEQKKDNENQLFCRW